MRRELCTHRSELTKYLTVSQPKPLIRYAEATGSVRMRKARIKFTCSIQSSSSISYHIIVFEVKQYSLWKIKWKNLRRKLSRNNEHFISSPSPSFGFGRFLQEWKTYLYINQHTWRDFLKFLVLVISEPNFGRVLKSCMHAMFTFAFLMLIFQCFKEPRVQMRCC